MLLKICSEDLDLKCLENELFLIFTLTTLSPFNENYLLIQNTADFN